MFGLLTKNRSHYWQKGDPLTEQDFLLLKPLVAFYQQHGFTPTKKDIASVGQIKFRFRTWGIAVQAAGLPWVNYPEQQQARAKARRAAAAEETAEEAESEAQRENKRCRTKGKKRSEHAKA